MLRVIQQNHKKQIKTKSILFVPGCILVLNYLPLNIHKPYKNTKMTSENLFVLLKNQIWKTQHLSLLPETVSYLLQMMMMFNRKQDQENNFKRIMRYEGIFILQTFYSSVLYSFASPS